MCVCVVCVLDLPERAREWVSPHATAATFTRTKATMARGFDCVSVWWLRPTSGKYRRINTKSRHCPEDHMQSPHGFRRKRTRARLRCPKNALPLRSQKASGSYNHKPARRHAPTPNTQNTHTPQQVRD